MKLWVNSIFIFYFNLNIALMFLKEVNFKVIEGKMVKVA